ncbi:MULTISPECIES: FAD-binding protein [Thermus]|uniref:2-hydroxy-acid oxidase n=2 Tax=Thermus scotoductus TaxID=37636 RepID=A0A0N1KQJ6_THESC|nr:MULTISPECIES: FAD-binding protein [Thermus]ADW21174.1 glycolate oxidase, subunit GlcE [Thermus scotoductus SA-01]ETN88420.1 2-hydroxy-acid oxidase [Thermus sp. NMX2.A1]KPD25948.1 2-hydroxy-acid oxidase [Thermus scotoductus]RTG95814.1 FAD-binding protein [Thermus scotoductus]RTH01659.1 FAD-binding protein [Thermus scotoductus]
MPEVRANSLEEVQEAVRTCPRLRPKGGGSKPALSTPKDGETLLDLSGLRGILEYAPEEFVFTAYAGTPLKEIEETLRAHGQYLPFHPPLVEQGATLGGTVAAGLSGPMRERFGGLRDFILGVRFVDGEGRVVRGGGKVVKNAAGFPFHRLMVGSLGAFGVMVELSFKVFPSPRATQTLRLTYGNLAEALAAMERLRVLPLDLLALDLIPPATLEIRLGGFPESLGKRLKRLQEILQKEGEVLAEDETHWEGVRNLRFLEEAPTWVKVPSAPAWVPKLEDLPLGPRRYLAGGELLYAGMEAKGLASLRQAGIPHLVLKGAEDALFPHPPEAFFRKLKLALDPRSRFPLG